MVVIAIIGIMTAVLYGSFGEARENARNKALQSELKEVQLALEVYRAQNGEYPPASGGPTPVGCQGAGSGAYGTSDFRHTRQCNTIQIMLNMVPEFVAEIPHHSDSRNANCDIYYYVDDVDHSFYKLVATQCYEGAASAAEGIQPDSEFARCPDSCTECAGVPYNATYTGSAAFYESLAVYSAGGQCI